MQPEKKEPMEHLPMTLQLKHKYGNGNWNSEGKFTNTIVKYSSIIMLDVMYDANRSCLLGNKENGLCVLYGPANFEGKPITEIKGQAWPKDYLIIKDTGILQQNQW